MHIFHNHKNTQVGEGASLHHFITKKRYAINVWKRRKEKRIDKKFGCIILPNSKRTPNIARRFPRHRTHEVTPNPSGFFKIQTIRQGMNLDYLHITFTFPHVVCTYAHTCPNMCFIHQKVLLGKVEKMLSEDIAKLMQMIPQEEVRARNEGGDVVKGGAFDDVLGTKSPFMFKGGEGVNAGIGETEWVVLKDQVIFPLIIYDIYHIQHFSAMHNVYYT